MKPGKVYLVGAGPGDPRLLTVGGAECVGRADVVVYDRLINPQLLSLARPDAELIYVGKGPQERQAEQEDITALLVSRALEGKTVVRLKGGDPYVFGRGGEEAETLVAAGVPFEVLPGVTSAIAAPAYAGIPLTHRDYASSFAVVTGRESEDRDWVRTGWDKLATATDTLVVLMGLGNIEAIVENLVGHGRPASTPVALVHRGTQPQQVTVTGTLADIVQRARDAKLSSPVAMVVGEVVRLRERLRWFDSRPLFGKRVLVPRTREQAGQLSRLLAEAGAQPVELPTISVHPPTDWGPLDKAIGHLSRYRWIAFTSVNGVKFFFQRLQAKKRDTRALGRCHIAAIGPATAKALEARYLRPDLIPAEYTSAEVFVELIKVIVPGQRVLLPRADIAPEVLAEGLRKYGAAVDEVAAYHTETPSGPSAEAQALFRNGQVDAVAFTSSSTVQGLVALLGPDRGTLDRCVVACIGPVTAATARELGLRVDVEAAEHTIQGLVQALAAFAVRR
ncbi:MAG: uroporphyrinogen-III C-methyltransferase [Chloroflexi bacterium]|nr:uroporphyrinogen-III C-methyltransferase [Chloroflexota bacterium]